jgi:hypothetical protein
MTASGSKGQPVEANEQIERSPREEELLDEASMYRDDVIANADTVLNSTRPLMAKKSYFEKEIDLFRADFDKMLSIH